MVVEAVKMGYTFIIKVEDSTSSDPDLGDLKVTSSKSFSSLRPGS